MAMEVFRKLYKSLVSWCYHLRTSAAKKPTICRLLALPPEIRNNIWQLAFTTEANDDAKTDLLRSKPPEMALLLACRQIRRETSDMYAEARRRYYRDTSFYLSSRAHRVSQRDVEALKDTDLDEISKLALYAEAGRHASLDKGRFMNNLIWADGIWRSSNLVLPARACRLVFYGRTTPPQTIVSSTFVDETTARARLGIVGMEVPLKQQIIYLLGCREPTRHH